MADDRPPAARRRAVDLRRKHASEQRRRAELREPVRRNERRLDDADRFVSPPTGAVASTQHRRQRGVLARDSCAAT